jgi:hypothetical protein
MLPYESLETSTGSSNSPRSTIQSDEGVVTARNFVFGLPAADTQHRYDIAKECEKARAMAVPHPSTGHAFYCISSDNRV